jgi:hypothetical protein
MKSIGYWGPEDAPYSNNLFLYILEHPSREDGGGILATRDHQDLGSWLCTLGGVGRAHFFHTRHADPDESRHVRDDQDTKSISWPNYHSGSNGDYQKINPIAPVHEVLLNSASESGVIKRGGSLGDVADLSTNRLFVLDLPGLWRVPLSLIDRTWKRKREGHAWTIIYRRR